MGPSLSPTVRRVASAAGVAVCGLALSIGLAGCPGAAELESPGRFDALAGSGTGTSGSSTGGSGTSGTSGAGPTGGSGGGATDCVQPLPDNATVGCDYSIIRGTSGHCSRGGCHDRSFASAGLDLTPDDLLISRILNVPARHGSIQCDLTTPCDPAAPACDSCRMCMPVGSPPYLLLDKANPAASWVIKKMEAFDVENPSRSVDMGCGDSMPISPGNTGFTAERRNCLTMFFTKLAEVGTPCTVSGTAGSGGT